MRVYYRSRRRRHGVILGLLLVGLGAALMVDRLPGWHYGSPWSWWSLWVIGLGVVRIATMDRPKDLADGVFFVLLGGWFWLVQTGWHGLTWANSWSLVLIAVGASMVVHALAARWMPRRDDDGCGGVVDVETGGESRHES